MSAFVRHLRSNLVGYIALFVALGGTGYAATSLPRGSVGTRALKNHSVTPIKFDRRSIGGYIRDWATIYTPPGVIANSRPRAHLVYWNAGGGLVSWNDAIPKSCFVLATSPNIGAAAYASAYISSAGYSKSSIGAVVELSSPNTPVNVAVICPQR